ncbi:DUF3237 domain-containing protein [Rhizobium paknamense]|uniref:UPF0311 protein QO005_004179 n=1 Tax=Rhizobium paknamense TaxID=1206817 RepID=A0ABU0IKP6_9HYPH|nr:DUF3237 domain-containing protein [Rhizobium paknamense]MDQ0457821.1 hypothetical protein [Rhizobium paknamense]
MTTPGGLPTGQIPVEPTISGPSAPMPGLEFAFSARVELLEPVEQGTVNGLRLRFVPIRGGTIDGPRLSGRVLPGGGDWQSIRPDGLTEVRALYQLQADDGTVISIENTGVRSASPVVTDRINRGEAVGPDDYYFRTTPRFTVEDGVHGWLARSLFIARAIRMPDHVIVDFYTVT